MVDLVGSQIKSFLIDIKFIKKYWNVENFEHIWPLLIYRKYSNVLGILIAKSIAVDG